MPRIFKGTETLLKLFVPRVDEGNLETLKIGLFTDDTNNAAEFYGDNMTIDGDTVYLKVNAWSFDGMNDGVLNYIAEIEIGEETIITERQSNYYLKTPNQYVPVGPDLSDYYTKPEIDEMLEDIEVDVDLTGYATEQYVNDAIANIDIPEGGSGGESVIVEVTGYKPTLDEYNTLYESAIAGKPTYVKYESGIFNVIALNNTKEASMNNSLFHIYIENTKTYFVWWYTSNFSTGVVESKSVVAGFDGTIDKYECSSNDIKINSISGTLPPYLMTYGGQDMAPLSFIKDKSATMIQDGKLYYFDFVNGEKDGLYTKPQVIDLLNIQGGGLTKEIITLDGENGYSMNASDAGKVLHGDKICYVNYVKFSTEKGTEVFQSILNGGRYETPSAFINYVWSIIDGKLFTWEFPADTADAIPTITPISSGDADLSNYYTKEETDNLIANSSVMLETTADGVLTYSQIRTLRNNWTNAYIKTHWQENNVTMDKYVAITSLFLNDILGDNKNIHLEGICEGYLYTWDIKGSNTEGSLVRTPISAGGAAKAVVVETEKSGTVYTDILAYSKLAIIQENIGNVYIRGKLNQDSTDINNAVVTNVACHPMFDMLGLGNCKVTAMNAANVYTWTFTNKTTQTSPTITPISEGGSNSIVYHIGTDWDLTEAYNYFNEGKTIILIDTDGRVGMVTDVSNAGMIRLNGFLGDLSGDAKPNRFECNNSSYIAEWKMAFHEDIEEIYSRLENGEGGGSGDFSDYYTKSEINTKLEGVALKSEGNTLGNYVLEDSAIVALSTGYLNRRIVEKARNEYKALFVQVAQGNHPSTTKRIPVTIEAHTDSNADITGYTVWGWYSKTQTITWTFSMTNTDVHYTLE